MSPGMILQVGSCLRRHGSPWAAPQLHSSIKQPVAPHVKTKLPVAFHIKGGMVMKPLWVFLLKVGWLKLPLDGFRSDISRTPAWTCGGLKVRRSWMVRSDGLSTETDAFGDGGAWRDGRGRDPRPGSRNCQCGWCIGQKCWLALVGLFGWFC